MSLRHAQNGNAGDNQFNRDLAKKTAILLRFREILLRKEEEFLNDDNYGIDEAGAGDATERRTKTSSSAQNLDPLDPNYYYDKNPLFDISKSISLLLDRGAMINHWRTGRSNATTFTFNDGSFQTLFGDANCTSVFCRVRLFSVALQYERPRVRRSTRRRRRMYEKTLSGVRTAQNTEK